MVLFEKWGIQDGIMTAVVKLCECPNLVTAVYDVKREKLLSVSCVITDGDMHDLLNGFVCILRRYRTGKIKLGEKSGYAWG